MLIDLDLLHVSKTPNILHIGSLPKNLQNIYWDGCPNVGEQKISNAQVQQGDSSLVDGDRNSGLANKLVSQGLVEFYCIQIYIMSFSLL
jgi:hypothetical protein